MLAESMKGSLLSSTTLRRVCRGRGRRLSIFQGQRPIFLALWLYEAYSVVAIASSSRGDTAMTVWPLFITFYTPDPEITLLVSP